MSARKTVHTRAAAVVHDWTQNRSISVLTFEERTELEYRIHVAIFNALTSDRRARRAAGKP